MFVMFDRHALLDELRKEYEGLPSVQKIRTFAANVGSYADEILRGALTKQGYAGIAKWDELMTEFGYEEMITEVAPTYVDQLMPFNVSIHFSNEYGQRAQIDLFGVEIINSGTAISIDDVVTNQAMTFVARSLNEMHKV